MKTRKVSAFPLQRGRRIAQQKFSRQESRLMVK
jgi:hypothetical protein